MNEERLIELLEQMFERIGFGDLAKNMAKVNKGLNDAQLKAKAQNELYKRTKETFEELNKKLADGKKKYVDLGDSLKSLEESIDKVTDAKKREELSAKREELARDFLSAQYKKAGVDISKTIGSSLVKGVANAAKNLVSGLQSGGSGISLAADLMSTAIDTTQSIFTGVAKSGETVGTALLTAGGKFTRLGGVVTLVSTGLEYLTSAISSAAKEGVRLLATEAEKTIKAFNTATSAGALFGRGMDDVRMYATQAGLTVEQFSNVLKNNSEALAESGYTVSEGAKKVADVTGRFTTQTGKSGQTLQRELLNLGFGFEEQADLTAKIISDLKRTGGQASSSQIATATVEMAKNMRAVADIMGEEAKSRMDAAKKASEQYAFQAKVMEIARRTNDPTLFQRVNQAMALKSEADQRAFIQAVVLNGAVTDLTANLTGAADSGRDAARALLAGGASIQDLTRGTVALNEKFQSGTNQIGSAISTLSIATGDMSDVARGFDEQQKMSFKVTGDNIDKAIRDAETLSGAQGGLQGELMGVEVAAQSLKMSIQDILTPTVKKFGKVANEVLDSVHAAVKGTVGSQAPSLGERIGRGSAQIIGGALGIGTTLLLAPETMGASLLTGGALTMGGAQLGGELYDQMFGGFAEGGVAKGPETGYQTTLHGTEAVVPLPDGKTIPVNMDTGALTSAINQQSGILNEILKTMRDNNTLTSGILQHSM